MMPHTQQKSTHIMKMIIVMMMMAVTTAMATMTTITIVVPNNKSASCSFYTSLNLQIPVWHPSSIHTKLAQLCFIHFKKIVLAPVQKLLSHDLIT